MEFALSPGKTAFFINVITDVIAVTGAFGLIITLNGYGRWRLHQNGKVNLDMHFHDMSFAGAFLNLIRLRRSSKRVVIMLLVQAMLFLFMLVLKVLAPIGVSVSEKNSVHRTHTLPGETLCLESTVSSPSTMIGIASERVAKHFQSGGQLLSVGRTGRAHDGILLEDEQRSFGRANIVSIFDEETTITLSDVPGHWEFDLESVDFLKNTTGYPANAHVRSSLSAKNISVTSNTRVFQGPLYVVVCVIGATQSRHKGEKCAFSRCSVQRVELKPGESKKVLGSCSVVNLERNVFNAGVFIGYSSGALPPLLLDTEFEGLDVVALGKRSLMINDLAQTLTSQPCGDTYVAYRSQSRVSFLSVGIVCALGATALVCCLTAVISMLMTRNTFNWNGSYHRVVNIAASSDPTGLPARNDLTAVGKTDVVIEERQTHDGQGLYVHIVPADVPSNPVPRMSHKLYHLTVDTKRPSQ